MGSSSVTASVGGEQVRRIIEEMRLRCRALEGLADVAERVRRYHEDVVEFVKLINSDFFAFVAHLNEELGAAGLGGATLDVRPEQPALVEHLDPMRDWAVRRFSLVRADLSVRLRYVVRGVETHQQSLDAAVFFWPQLGVIEWRDGHRERFRVQREGAFDEARFGSLDFWDLLSRVRSRRTGREEIGHGAVVDDPEAIVLRRVCLDDRWPGWIE